MSLPYTKQVAYIESTGTQYIDTGFKPNQDTRIVATMQCVTSTNYGRLFGCGTYNTLNSVMIDYETGITGTLHIKYGNNSSWTNISSVHGDYEIHTYDFNKNNLYKDSELVSSNTYGAFQSTSNLGIFTYINGSSIGQSTEFFIGRLYGFKIYDNDVLVRDFIPVRIGNEGCLYDNVSGELFRNKGTGDFIFDEIPEHSPLISNIRRRLLYAKPKELRNYLCFTALESGTFTYSIPEAMTTLNIDHVSFNINGQSWTKLNNIDNEAVSITTPTVNAGDKVYWKGSGQRLANSTTVYSNFDSTCKFDVSGNIASLLYEDTFEDFYSAPRCEYMFGLVFSGSKVVHAGELVLPVTRVYYTYYLYARLFQNCTELVECAPIIFANVLACWQYTYSGCTKLENPPIFPEDLTFSANSVFSSMFEGCTSLRKTPKLPYPLTNGCYQSMFSGCTSLTEVDGGLPAEPIIANCYRGMFYNCTSLTNAPELNFEQMTSYSSAYQEMFVNTKVNYLKCMSISAIDATRWLNGVPDVSTSIFVKHIDATWTTTGNSGVPTNWTVIYYDPALDKYYLDQQREIECDDHGNPLVNPNYKIVPMEIEIYGKYQNPSSNTLSDNANYCTTYYYEIEDFDSVAFFPEVSSAYSFVYDENYDRLGNVGNINNANIKTVYPTAKYVRFSGDTNNNMKNPFMVFYNTTNYVQSEYALPKTSNIKLFKPEIAIRGKYLPATGVETNMGNYSISEYYEIVADRFQPYLNRNRSYCHAYDANEEWLFNLSTNTSIKGRDANATYIRVSEETARMETDSYFGVMYNFENVL